MSNAVKIEFQVGGIARVSQAFRSVEQAVVRAEQASLKSTKQTSNERVKIAGLEEKRREKEFEKLAKTAAKWEQQSVKDTEKAEKEKVRIAERSAKYMDTVRHNSALAAGRYAEQVVRQEEAAAKRIQSTRARIARTVGGTVSGTLGKLGNAAVNMGGAALALGGGFGIADTVQKSFAAQRSAAQLVNAVTSGGKPPDGANVANIMGKAGAVSMATGMDKDAVIQGTLAYARSARGGDFGGAMNNMEFFAKMAKTTGADINDIAGAAGTLQSQNADLGKDPAKMRQMLLNAYAQSKQGSVSMSEAAKQIGVLGSTRGYYQGDEGKNQQTLMGLGQIAASGGSSEEIGTYIKNLSMEAGKHSKELKGMGVKFNSSGQMESPEQMIGAVMKGTGGDMSKIEKLFGARGMPLFGELGKTFRDAGGGDKGVNAIQKQIQGVAGASMSEKDLDSQFNQVMSTSAEKFSVAQQKLTEAIEAKLTPYIEKLGDKISDPAFMKGVTDFIDGVAKVAAFFMDNPFLGIGAVVLASITKDLAGAALGAGVKAAMEGAISKGGGGALAIAGIGAIAITAEKAWIEQGTAEDKNRVVDQQADITTANNLIYGAKNPGAKVDVEAAKKQIAALQSDEAHIADKSSFGQVASIFQTDEDKKAEVARNTKNFQEMEEAIKKLNAAIAATTTTLGGKPGAPAGGAADPHRNQPVAAPPRGGTQ